MRKVLVRTSVLTLALLVFGMLGFAQSSSSADKSADMGNTSAQTSTSANSGNGNLNDTDRNFLTKAAQDGLGEVQIAQLAEQKATNDHIKDMSRKLVDDHTKANDQLKDIASKQNLTMPTQPSEKDKDRYDRLSKLSGQQFEQAFLREQVKDHQKDIQEFQNEANNGKDPQLKQFAQQNLSVLQQHLQMAQQMERQGAATTASTRQ